MYRQWPFFFSCNVTLKEHGVGRPAWSLKQTGVKLGFTKGMAFQIQTKTCTKNLHVSQNLPCATKKKKFSLPWGENVILHFILYFPLII